MESWADDGDLSLQEISDLELTIVRNSGNKTRFPWNACQTRNPLIDKESIINGPPT